MAAEVLIIMGSVRANRRCPDITAWVAGLVAEAAPLSCEIIDLADWHLPLDDEPEIPAIGPYNSAATQAWSDKVASARGFIFVTPQYNWGYPAALKNAIDHLYREWRNKPAVIVTYGGHGGNKCAAQLRQVFDGLKIQTMPTMPALELPSAVVHGAPLDVAAQFAPHAAAVTAAVRELAGQLVAEA